MHSFTHSFTHSVTHSHSSPLFLCFGCAENRRKRSVQRLLLRERKHTHTHMRRPLSFPQSSHESTVLCESRHHDSNKSQHSNTNMQANKQTISTLTEAKDKHHAVQERESARDVCARARVCVCVCVCVCAQRLISLTFSAPSSCTRCSCTHHSDTPPCSPHPAGTEGRTEGSRVEHVERGV